MGLNVYIDLFIKNKREFIKVISTKALKYAIDSVVEISCKSKSNIV